MRSGGLPLLSELGELTFAAALPALQHLSVCSSYQLIKITSGFALPALRSLMVRLDYSDDGYSEGIDAIASIPTITSLRKLIIDGKHLEHMVDLRHLHLLTLLDLRNTCMHVDLPNVHPPLPGDGMDERNQSLQVLHLRWGSAMTWQHAVEALSHLRHLSICKVPSVQNPMDQFLQKLVGVIGTMAISTGCCEWTNWWLRKLATTSGAVSEGVWAVLVSFFLALPALLVPPVTAVIQFSMMLKWVGGPRWRPRLQPPASLAALKAKLQSRGCRVELVFRGNAYLSYSF